MATLFSILGAVAGFIASAILGLGFWRYQTLGKRRYEVAEQLSNNSTKIVGAFLIVRSVGGGPKEGSTRPRGKDETPQQTQDLDGLYIAVERLNNLAGDFAKIFESHTLCRMHFGLDAAKPFNDFHRLHLELLFSARRVARGRGDDKDEQVIWQGLADEDTFHTRMETAAEQINQLCEQYLRPHPLTMFLPWVSQERARRISASMAEFRRRYRLRSD